MRTDIVKLMLLLLLLLALSSSSLLLLLLAPRPKQNLSAILLCFVLDSCACQGSGVEINLLLVIGTCAVQVATKPASLGLETASSSDSWGPACAHACS